MPTHIKRVPLGDLDPLLLYRRLREHSPGRSSVLLEGVELPGSSAGCRRGSIVGYLARAEGAFGSGVDAISALAEDALVLESDGVPGPDADPLDRLAARLSYAAFGVAAAGSGLAANGIPPWPDEPNPGREMSNLTVGLVDPDAGAVVIAGRSSNACERFAWELSHPKTPDPERPALAAPAAPPGDDASWVLPDKDHKKACGRLLLRMEMAGFPSLHLHLARCLPAPGADPLDALRALRELGRDGPTSTDGGLFFFDFGRSPSAGGFTLLGRLGRTTRADEGAAFAKEFALSLPTIERVGGPPERRLEAARLLRDQEPLSRGYYGGAAGFAFPGGGGLLGELTGALFFEDGVFELGVGVDVKQDDDADAIRAHAEGAGSELLRAARFARDRAATR